MSAPHGEPIYYILYGYVALWNAGIKPPREVGSTPTVSTIACDGGHKQVRKGLFKGVQFLCGAFMLRYGLLNR